MRGLPYFEKSGLGFLLAIFYFSSVLYFVEILEMDTGMHVGKIPRHCVSSNEARPTSHLVVLVAQGVAGCKNRTYTYLVNTDSGLRF